MDPQQTWANMLDALKRRKWNEAKEFADALHEWLTKGGFPPITVGDESLGNEWHKTIAAFACLYVANKVTKLEKRRKKRKSMRRSEGGD